MQAAFVDIGVDKDAFLYVSEAVSGKETGADSSDVSHTNADVYKPRIEQLVKPGQEITVQVIKEPVEGKGARITTNITLPGKYAVLVCKIISPLFLGKLAPSRKENGLKALRQDFA